MRRTLVISITIALSLSTFTPPAARASFPGRNGRLVWATPQPNFEHLMVGTTDGKHLSDLTDYSNESQPSDIQPMWSPNGRWVAFNSTRPDANGDRKSGTYLVRADGLDSHLHLVVQATLRGWSPNGRRLLIQTSNERLGGVLSTIRRDGTHRKRLINFGYSYVECVAWSPTGRWITFCGGKRQERPQWLCLVHPDGSGRHCLGHHPRWNPTFVRWSPDGQWISFYREFVDTNSTDIYAYRISDGKLRRLTSSQEFERMAVWSPDGRRIAYIVNGRTIIKNIDGTHRHSIGMTADYIDWGPRPR